MNQDVQSSGTEPTFTQTVRSIFKSYPTLLEKLLPAALGLALFAEIGQYMSVRELAQASYHHTPGLAYWAGLALTLLAGSYFFIVGILQTDSRMLERESEDSYNLAWSIFPSMIGTVLIYAMIVIVGLLMFVVPGLVLMVLFLMGQVNVSLKRAAPFDALMLSFRQVWGNFWFVACTLLVTVVPLMVAISLVNAQLQPLQMTDEVPAHLAVVLLGILMTVLAFPLGMSCMWHLYQALEKHRKSHDSEAIGAQTDTQ